MVPDEETVLANMSHQMDSKNSITLDIRRPEFLPLSACGTLDASLTIARLQFPNCKWMFWVNLKRPFQSPNSHYMHLKSLGSRLKYSDFLRYF